MADLIDRAAVMGILQRAIKAYRSRMREAASEKERRDWQSMLFAAVDIEGAIAALPAVTQPAPHVSQTPKTEHDASNVLTAGAIRAAALREAADFIEHAPAGTRFQDRDAILALLTEKAHDRAALRAFDEGK